MFTNLINPIAILLSLSTATGILVHDTKIDRATTTAMISPLLSGTAEANMAEANVRPDLHTHVERMSVAGQLQNLRSQNPRIQPRAYEDRKHLMAKYATKGVHAFDNYYLPLD